MQNDKEKYGRMSKEEKYQVLKDMRIVYPSFAKALELIKKCHESTKKSVNPQCMLITGKSGAGKSTVFDTFIKLHDKIIEEETRTKRVLLWAELPSPITLMSFLETLLDQLGDPYPGKGKKSEKRKRLVKLIKECGVELILLDEFQHLVHSENQKINHDVSDCFKSIVNETKVPVVLFGLEESRTVVDCNAQLKRRFSLRWNIPVFGIESVERIREFAMLLHQIDMLLPLAKPVGLGTEEMVSRFYHATGGLMDSIIKIIGDAVELAIEKEQETIYLKDFSEAYNFHSHLHEGKKIHPFDSKELPIKLEIRDVS
jgi:hypothetical protein